MKTKKTPKKSRNRSSGSRSSESIESRENWVPIRIPHNLEEMVAAWVRCEEPNIGWCFMCNRPIRSADDLINETATHDCERGRRLEEQARATEEAEQRERAPKRPSVPRKPPKRSS